MASLTSRRQGLERLLVMAVLRHCSLEGIYMRIVSLFSMSMAVVCVATVVARIKEVRREPAVEG